MNWTNMDGLTHKGYIHEAFSKRKIALELKYEFAIKEELRAAYARSGNLRD